jgi:hypothetical protein
VISGRFFVAEIQARLFEFLPRPPLTTSQVDLLNVDNLATGELPRFREVLAPHWGPRMAVMSKETDNAPV